MSHKILGLDLGGSSLKLARFEAGFRRTTLQGVAVRPLAIAASATTEERLAGQLAALREAIAGEQPPIEEIAVALPAELCSFRLVDLPIADPRKIESILPYELESQLLTPLDEVIIDFVIVGPLGAETRLLAVTAPRAVIAKLVELATTLTLPIRVVGAAPLAYAALLPAPPPLPAGAAPPLDAPPDTPALVLDLGDRQSTLCVVRSGRPELARSLPRGGQQLTAAVAAAFNLDLERAETAKLEAGFLAHGGLQAETPGQLRMDECLKDALAPLLREIRQTLASYRASYGASVEQLLLAGGSSRLPGLAEHLSEELGLPVSPLRWRTREGVNEPHSDSDRIAVAVGVGLAAAGGVPQVNFRRGEFAFRSDFSFLRAKAFAVAASVLAIFAFASINALASLRGLRQEHDQLTIRLKRETVELFGKERLDGRAISDEVRGGPKGSGPPPIPSVTAFDLLDEIARTVPPKDKIKLDVMELDIKPKKLFLKATAETAQQMDDLADALAKIECFEEVQKGKLASFTGPPVVVRDKDGKEVTERKELKQFTLNITTTCP